ncbi:MAG TPA: MOSC domain-containing protein [Pseudolysinimonas sp.]|nr:MOSC domain-containing protein [Pseudolysinimonas sp.]
MSVVAVARSRRHGFSKERLDEIVLVEGFGVEGDAHFGQTVQHRSRIRYTPHLPNLRQVHLMHAELFDQVAADGFAVTPGELGENITTRGIDLLALPTGTLLRLGEEAVVEVTGLRNPCVQIDRFQSGLMKRLVHTDDDGQVVRLAGIMGIVRAGGAVRPGDAVTAQLPAGEPRPLQPV